MTQITELIPPGFTSIAKTWLSALGTMKRSWHERDSKDQESAKQWWKKGVDRKRRSYANKPQKPHNFNCDLSRGDGIKQSSIRERAALTSTCSLSGFIPSRGVNLNRILHHHLFWQFLLYTLGCETARALSGFWTLRALRQELARFGTIIRSFHDFSYIFHLYFWLIQLQEHRRTRWSFKWQAQIQVFVKRSTFT